MPFSRITVIKIVERFVGSTHAGLDKSLVEFGLEDVCPDGIGGLAKREAALIKHLVKNPDAKGPKGSDLIFELAEGVVEELHRRVSKGWGLATTIEQIDPELVNALRQDGYEIENGKLKRSLPEELDLATSKDEVRERLERFGLGVPLGHLEQAVSAHARGEWASANSQLRTYIVSLFDGIARLLNPKEAASRTSEHTRQELLAQLTPPFLRSDLNEWVIGDRGGFIQGFLRRLHPEGSHPGLSDEEDSTFRLHMVLLVSRHLLRRLDDYQKANNVFS